MVPNKDELLGKDIEELESYMISIGEAAFRARQIFKWIYSKRLIHFMI